MQVLSIIRRQYFRTLALCTAGILFLPFGLLAAGPPKPSTMSNPLAQVLVVIIVALLLAIALLANVVLGAADIYMQKIKEARKKSGAEKTILLLMLLLISGSAMAAEEPNETVAAVASTIGGLSPIAFYALMSVIGLELVVLLWLLYHLKNLLANEAAVKATATVEAAEPAWKRWWYKANSFKSIKEEADIDLGHDYDGIRELDNRLPPWWLYGFYACIIFSVIYLWRYHVSHTAPLSGEELAISMEKAAAAKEEYLKKAANNVDENTVTYLADAGDLDAGKKLFVTSCAACHAADGGGMVGPNLTDNYWLHGGGMADVFKSIKYGWPEKGMKSWKDDFSPGQIAQIASYVKSLKGTKPATPKEAQGTLYEEQAKPADSSVATLATPKKSMNP